MNKYQKGQEILKGLEFMNFKGDLSISIPESNIYIKVTEVLNLVPQTIVKPTGVVKQAPQAEVKNVVSKNTLYSINWGYPGSKGKGGTPWKDIIVAALDKVEIKTLDQLLTKSYTELATTRGIMGLAPIIRDSLVRAGYLVKIS